MRSPCFLASALLAAASALAGCAHNENALVASPAPPSRAAELAARRDAPTEPALARSSRGAPVSGASAVPGAPAHARAAKETAFPSIAPDPSSSTPASGGASAAQGGQNITVEPSAIRIVEPIAFDMHSDTPRATSLPAIAAVVEILAERHDIQLVTVTGHASLLEKAPQKLSERRATHVADALSKGGVEQRRLVARGVGSDRASEERGEWPCRVDFKMARSATDG